MSSIGLIAISVAVVALFVAIFVLIRNPKSPIHRWLFVFTAVGSFWTTAVNLIGLVGPDAGIYVIRASFAAVVLISFSMIMFVDSLIGSSKKRIYVLFCTLLALGLALSASDLVIASFIKYETGGVNIPDRGPAYLVVIAIILTMVVYAITRITRRLLKTKGVRRAQLTIVEGGLVLGTVAGVLSNVILPNISGDTSPSRFAFVAIIIWTSFFAYAVARHRFLDIRLIIARTLAYSTSLLTLAGLYGFALFVVAKLVFDVDISFKTQVALSVLTALAALTFGPMKSFFARRTNQLFYQDAYDAQAFFDRFNRALVSTIDLDRLLRDASDTIVEYLKADYCVVGVKELDSRHYRIIGTAPKVYPSEEISAVRQATPGMHQVVIVADELAEERGGLKQLLVKNNISLLARLTQDANSGKEGLGYIVLGPKKSGNPYSGQDIKVLEAAANELVVAIQNAMRFEEIERFNATLQDKIDDATRKLRKTNDRLRVLDQTKDDFISMASHQLRTPLTSVKGYVSMVLDGDGGRINEVQRKLLTQSFLSSQRMVYLISDLLNVSRLKTGKFIIEPVETNLANVIEEEVEQLVETVKSRGLELNYHKPEHFPMLMLDETKIRQVLMNFIDNAIYYTPTGGHIDVYLVDKPDSIEFTVVDDGIGVPKHEQHHLFTKFYRAHNAKRARPDGTGLGIFMAKKVVIAQGGAVIFKSTEGKGSTFGFTFPKIKLLPRSGKS